MSTKPTEKSLKPIVFWLYSCLVAVFMMVVIGGITRLTESGLSMVEWRPLIGAIPPLNEVEWLRVFELYQQSPQFQKVNIDMNLAEFKNIFFWEWFHRLWGRMIGIIFAVPLLFFWITNRIPKGYGWRLFGLLLLGGAQGFMGWFMVKSGLVDNPAVSHYRLTAHLGLAFLIYALIYRTILPLSVEPDEKSVHLAPLSRHINIALGFAIITMIWGGFVAGLDAGLIYNSFPLMGQYPWPTEGLDMSPLWINVIENHATVQFIHRILAVITTLIILGLFPRLSGFNLPPKTNRLFMGLGIMVLVQAGLGITTLLTNVALHPAVMHQAGALLLLTLLLRVRYETPPLRYSYD